MNNKKGKHNLVLLYLDLYDAKMKNELRKCLQTNAKNLLPTGFPFMFEIYKKPATKSVKQLENQVFDDFLLPFALPQEWHLWRSLQRWRSSPHRQR